ncbi:hypothetical protein GCM10010406_21530 [Streptomyces thermolineatus]|uniref:DNA-binding phage zinc finger domain-containing protein n=1 Tax=Streptomyces thermolineatus TaxID=44033 RepID=A0ABP5YPT6_9ACTN
MNQTITFDEIGRLLGLAAARDQRTVGDADILAWHDDLNAAGVTFDDAKTALTRFYAIDMAALKSEHRRRVTSPDLIDLVRKIRAERLANFTYQPADDDNDPKRYLWRLRGQLAAVANGRVAPPSQRPALTGGPAPAVALRLRLAGAFGRVPDADDDSTENKVIPIGPMTVQCPDCQARIGRPCKTARTGKARPKAHAARIAASRGEAPRDREAAQADIERRRAAALRALEAMPDTTRSTQ